MPEQEMLENDLNPVEEPQTDTIPPRDAEDHLPTKPGWKVILSGIFYAAFGLLLLGIVIAALTGAGVTGFGWFIIIVFGIGAFAAAYSSYDELRHLNGALALDKGGKIETVTIVDDWTDHYEDGGIATRKDHFHILYLYAGGSEYAKHSVKKSDAPVLKTNTKIRVQYLPEDPKIYRPLFGE